MAETEEDQKTEEATAKRISEARDDGQLAVSRELSAWFSFIAVLMVVAWFGPEMGREAVTALRPLLEKPEQISLADGGIQDVLMGILFHVIFSLLLVYGTLFVVAILGTMIQTGFYVNPARIKFDIKKITSLSGLKRLFSMDPFVELGKSFVKIIVLGYIAYRVFKPVYAEVPKAIIHPFSGALSYLHDKAIYLVILMLLVITVVALADFLYVRWKYFKGLRMTKQEVKDEHKQMDGDPVVKARLRRIRLERSRKRMMANVPNASVVITNPTHYAVALEYKPKEMLAPVLIAKGPDLIAQRIRDVAEEHNIPLVSNPPLARALYDTVDLDTPITPEHYRAVAEVISYVYKLKEKI